MTHESKRRIWVMWPSMWVHVAVWLLATSSCMCMTNRICLCTIGASQHPWPRWAYMNHHMACSISWMCKHPIFVRVYSNGNKNLWIVLGGKSLSIFCSVFMGEVYREPQDQGSTPSLECLCRVWHKFALMHDGHMSNMPNKVFDFFIIFFCNFGFAWTRHWRTKHYFY